MIPGLLLECMKVKGIDMKYDIFKYFSIRDIKFRDTLGVFLTVEGMLNKFHYILQ